MRVCALTWGRYGRCQRTRAPWRYRGEAAHRRSEQAQRVGAALRPNWTAPLPRNHCACGADGAVAATTMQNHVRTRAPKQRYTNDAHLCMCALEHRHDQVLNVRRAQMYTYLHRYLPGGELFDVIYDTVASADPKDYRCLYCCF